VIAREKRSQIAFDIELVDDVCKLTVVHEYWKPDSVLGTMVSNGWPRVLSQLKTLLETGDVLTANSPEPT
jgi:hypothetical protein